MKNFSVVGGILTGCIGLVIGLLCTFGVSLVLPTTNLTWSLISVSFASFFASFAGYIVGLQSKDKEQE